MTKIKITKGSANVFEDLGFSAQESQNLLLRSQTMVALVQWFEASGMTQVQAANSLGITQPRFNQLLKGKIGIFSLDEDFGPYSPKSGGTVAEDDEPPTSE